MFYIYDAIRMVHEINRMCKPSNSYWQPKKSQKIKSKVRNKRNKRS